MAKGVFIVVDGMDGSGKSEIVKLLHNHLFSKSKSIGVLTTREPTNGIYGKEIRDILARDEDPGKNAEKLLDLFIKDREEHVNKIIAPFLEKTDDDGLNIIICDRYYYSTIAFQAVQGLDVNVLIDKNKGFPKPEIAFILDLEPETALERIKSREKEKFERVDFMNKLRENFLELPKLLEDNLKVIDASRGLQEVFGEIKKEVDELI